MKTPVYCRKTLLIGSGRLSQHLQFYCQSLGWDVQTTHRPLKLKSQPRSPRPMLFTWNRKRPKSHLHAALVECDQVWLAVSDSALETVIQTDLQGYRGKIVHFSGALEIPETLSVHPLMTFTHQLYAKSFYPQITWVHTQKIRWNWHFPLFLNPHRLISSKEKTAYHLLCVLSGNLPQILLNTATDFFAKLGLRQKDIAPYILQSIFNQQAHGWNGLTGPFVRQDQKTIQSHLKYLKSKQKSVVMTNKQKKLIQKIYLDFYSLYINGKAL